MYRASDEHTTSMKLSMLLVHMEKLRPIGARTQGNGDANPVLGCEPLSPATEVPVVQDVDVGERGALGVACKPIRNTGQQAGNGEVQCQEGNIMVPLCPTRTQRQSNEGALQQKR